MPPGNTCGQSIEFDRKEGPYGFVTLDGVQYRAVLEGDDTGSAVIRNASLYKSDITIPSQIYVEGRWFDVRSAYYGAFQFHPCLRDIHFEHPIGFTFSTGMFYGCVKLQHIDMPQMGVPVLYFINDWCFTGCKKLTSIEIPEGLEAIGCGAFKNCCSLSSVSLPDSLTKIETQAFEGCASLESIIIPRHVQQIGDEAFTKCPNLHTVIVEGEKDVVLAAKGAFDKKVQILSRSEQGFKSRNSRAFKII